MWHGLVGMVVTDSQLDLEVFSNFSDERLKTVRIKHLSIQYLAGENSQAWQQEHILQSVYQRWLPKGFYFRQLKEKPSQDKASIAATKYCHDCNTKCPCIPQYSLILLYSLPTQNFWLLDSLLQPSSIDSYSKSASITQAEEFDVTSGHFI